ncbi:hypothetical protein EYF80_063640 [Liparis tanakae]|uniref:Uncharacterized protein n=1 Tax=Liparis tanakae TaxID=230148 RepID=A0A4Z2EBW9_9TELE|nr:hypothetical protein EYF80_063640 [Liparis tanakae]
MEHVKPQQSFSRHGLPALCALHCSTVGLWLPASHFPAASLALHSGPSAANTKGFAHELTN